MEKQALEGKISKQESEKNEILQLYEKMKQENEARRRENADLHQLLQKEKTDLFDTLSRGTSEVRDMFEKGLEKKSQEYDQIQAQLQKLQGVDSKELSALRESIKKIERLVRNTICVRDVFNQLIFFPVILVHVGLLQCRPRQSVQWRWRGVPHL